ncbi:acyl-CoA dehydrogenase [Actinomadura viridis]|uniref:Alkylation response protein AidB-like acyl-CoA dehydrogenase n=1 Tax=Actinomadura viridis TaxID=58110 RepID=A0A931DDY4_9ACTN|nr:acyl-CoA dehydrogenase [Actinomadura viridis]MBG6086848.1 alkylation response protein AidB-like acyl-CoA dehydrogenase [Actinomadura viridis]
MTAPAGEAGPAEKAGPADKSRPAEKPGRAGESPERPAAPRVTYPPYERTAWLRRLLGDPDAPGGPFTRAAVAGLDAREEFPGEACRALDAAGLPRFYVPHALGGALESYEDVLQLVRLLAERDLTVAIAHGKTYLGAVTSWIAAGPAQARWLAGEVIGGTVVCWALTERDHGSDLLAGEVTATADGPGYRLDGEKWLINNAGRAGIACVLARTAPGGGPRGFSLLAVDLRRLPPGTVRRLPKVRTHGIRGADISGIAFDGAPVPASTLVGAPGAGLEIVLKALQLTRTMCAALSLGAGSAALRLTAGYAARRRRYGRPVAALPLTRRTLGRAAADLLLAEAVGLVASRSAHALPGELPVSSAVAKYLVPTTVEGVLARLGEVLGARAFLTGGTGDGPGDGAFQKIERDHRIVALFDGNTTVNLQTLIAHFPVLAAGHRRGRADRRGLAGALALRHPPTPFDPAALRLTAGSGCSLVQSLPVAVAEIRALGSAGRVPQETVVLAGLLGAEAARLHEEMAAHRPTARDVPPEAFLLARRYASLYAACACLWLWLDNRDWAAEGDTADLWADALWLRACLLRALPGHALRGLADGDGGGGGGEVFDRLLAVLDVPGGLRTSLIPGVAGDGAR